jgi:RNA polymerase sigma-70 factor (ECF subfamily)
MFRRKSHSPEPETTADVEGAERTLDPEARLDERLVENAQKGDLPSFNTLVTRHERVVYNICLRMLRDTALAEDATQDTFIKAWTAIDSFRGGLVRAWLLRIATNRCYDIIRAKGRRPADSLDAEEFEAEPDWSSQSDIAEHPEDHASRRELSAFLERALAMLPEDQRLAIVLSDVQGNSYEEIAEITGVAIGTVKSRISRSRSRLREIILTHPDAREHLEQFQRLFKDEQSEAGT